jgi:hypothetical protein
MALPTTILSSAGLGGYHPPYKSSGGAYYCVVLADADELDVYKATDPTDSWTIQDSGGGPVHAGTIGGFSTTVDDNIIHMIVWSAAAYEYWTFDMDTDQWVTDQAIESSIDANWPWGSIAVRSDGDVVVAYAGVTDANMGDTKERVDVNIRTGTTWGGPVALDAGGDVHYGNPNCVLGTNDGTHCLWQKQTSTVNDPPNSWSDLEARTLDSGDNLSTTDTDTEDTSAWKLALPHLISYDDAGTQRMYAGGRTGGVDHLHIPATEDGSDNIAFGTTHSPNVSNAVARDRVNGILEGSQASYVELDGDIHVLYGGGGSQGFDVDLYYTKSTDDAANWSTPTLEFAATMRHISVTTYVRGGNNRLAYFYDDNDIQKYNEKDLGAIPKTASGTPSIAKPTSSGTSTWRKIATGTPSLAKPTTSGNAQRALVITDVDGDEDWADGATGLVATGEGFV